jgi:cytochrome c
MRTSALAAAVFVLIGSPLAASSDDGFGIGRTATPNEIAGWDIDISPDGKGLPPGRGDVAFGKAVFAEKCASCHGDSGQGKPMDRLVGGEGTIASAKPIKTVGSYWPYATTLYDFVHRAMPFSAPQSLTPDEVYSVCAYLLFLNHIVPEYATLDAKTLPNVKMPAKGLFRPAP